MRCRTKTVTCFWLSYVVFMSSAWKKVYKDLKWRVWGRVLLVCPPLECHWLVLCWVAEEKELVQELAALPIGRDTVRVRNKRKEVESKLTELEEAIKIFSRPKVFVKVDPWNCPAHSCGRYVISMESVNASGCHCLGVAALPVTRSVPAFLVTKDKKVCKILHWESFLWLLGCSLQKIRLSRPGWIPDISNQNIWSYLD